MTKSLTKERKQGEAEHGYRWHLQQVTGTLSPLSLDVTLPTCLIHLAQIILGGTSEVELPVSSKL